MSKFNMEKIRQRLRSVYPFYDLAVVYAVNDVVYRNPVFKSFCEGMIYDVEVSGLNLLSDS